MLCSLHIKNIAIMDNVDIEFDNGFCVLTGETGAGKSILIDAINLLTGERSSKELVRTGEEKAIVEGALYTGDETVFALLDQAGIDFDQGEPLLVCREISKDGRSQVRVNGRMSTTGFLKQICGRLINIHGQKDSQSILDQSFHGTYLDAFSKTEAEFADYTAAYKAVQNTKKQLADIQTDNQMTAQRVEFLTFQINELKSADLQEGEEEELTAQRNKFLNSEAMLTAANRCYGFLFGDDELPGALDLLENSLSELATLSKFDKRADQAYEKIQDLKYELQDAADYVRDAKEDDCLEDLDINAIESRLDLLSRLKRKYGNSVAEMKETLANLEQELYGIENADYLEQQLTKQLAEQQEVLAKQADLLTAKRQKDASKLEKAVETELSALDMAKTKFGVQFTPCEYTAFGQEKVEFLIAPNVGEDLKPLIKIASGGELSRVILALKAVLAEADPVSTLIFDEVDTGVSGSAAQKIGEKLQKLAKNKQVFVITHLAQVAAFGQHHYKIQKGEKKGKTVSEVHLLDNEGRIDELARIMSGTTITESAKAAAKELLQMAGE